MPATGTLEVDMEYQAEREFGSRQPGHPGRGTRARVSTTRAATTSRPATASRFTLPQRGATVYGLAVAFGPSTGHGHVDFEIRWIDQDPEVGLGDSPYEFAEYTSDARLGPERPTEPRCTYPLAFEDELEVSVDGLASPGFYAGAVNDHRVRLRRPAVDQCDGNGSSDTDNSTHHLPAGGKRRVRCGSTSQTAAPGRPT